MATKRTTTTPLPPAAPARPPYMLIEEIRVQGYKSLVDATLHVRPLTLLAGTNSSGKSSIMQPLLLIKQTMEAPYQPAGALVLDGAHVQAETAGELVSKATIKKSNYFSIKLDGVNRFLQSNGSNQYIPFMIELSYRAEAQKIELNYQRTNYNNLGEIEISADKWSGSLINTIGHNDIVGRVIKSNGFMGVDFVNSAGETDGGIRHTFVLEDTVPTIMHIPGLRGLPKRNYLATTFQNQIKGTFDLYAAGTISQWQQQSDTEALAQLSNYLQRLGLTNSVTAKVKNANEVELSVNRLPSTSKTKPRKADMVNIADVGIGVSQVLPILVALIAAQEGQIVYVEQPELHLHPRAQVAMGEMLAEAANRGVRVIVETHSSLLLLTVQTLVAEGKIKPTDVGLHWFSRDAKGATTVRFEQPDENGAYGEWPEDFGDVEITAQRNYLDAVTRRQPKRTANV
ncbi:MAG: AAA family ATPase [Janthinobacterium lividum]